MKRSDLKSKSVVFDIFVHFALILMALTVLIPFSYIVFSSFATEKEILSRGFFLIPKEWTINAYQYLIHNSQFVTSFRNSIIITVVGTLINMTLSTLMAYGLSHEKVKGRKLINFLVIFSMIVHGGMIPTYLVVHNLGLISSYWSIWLVNAIAPFNLIVMRSFFQNLPSELKESARMDGCGEWRLLVTIILPLSLPLLATFTLFYSVANWNNYFHAILYLNDSSMHPLQVFLRQMLIVNPSELERTGAIGNYEYTSAVKNAAILLTALPLLVIYPFLQKYFKSGMLMGSLKD